MLERGAAVDGRVRAWSAFIRGGELDPNSNTQFGEGGEPVETGEVMSYLAAHQDYAYAVAGAPEMRFTNVSLAGEGR